MTGRGDPFNFNDIYEKLGADGLVHRPMKMSEQKKVQTTPETGERHSVSGDLDDLVEVTRFCDYRQRNEDERARGFGLRFRPGWSW